VTLERMMRSVRVADRRVGLVNLCWLAHSRDVAECLRELEGKYPSVKKLKYSLHPAALVLLQRLDQVVRRTVEQADPARASFLTGARENVSLVDAIIEDGFAFTELSISEFDFNAFLASNKRYRLAADLFFEMYSVLLKETERRPARERPGPAGARGPSPARPAQGAAPDPGRHRQGDGERPGAHVPPRRRLEHGAKLLAWRSCARRPGAGAPAEITEVFLGRR
jgi:hypothetical protein